jgi:hypothetical protein
MISPGRPLSLFTLAHVAINQLDDIGVKAHALLLGVGLYFVQVTLGDIEHAPILLFKISPIPLKMCFRSHIITPDYYII